MSSRPKDVRGSPDKAGRGDLEKAIWCLVDALNVKKDLGSTQGWPEMEKTLRKGDEDKASDCKEDIDTLLIFAGLFAAVLTPLLVESFKTMSPDPNETEGDVLRRISNQTSSYRINDRFLNSTVPPFPEGSPSFVLPRFALSINVLWFSSLTMALATASFGLLVKQWLREYLSIESTNAKMRLRIRQFRKGGLKTWRVYGIAAVLPFLFQLSLGLFFVGLCFFSWSVHQTIGRTITSLVAAWAFLFIFAILAPVLSARCPYKSAMAKSILPALRKGTCSNISSKEKDDKVAPFEDQDAAVDPIHDVDILTAADAILLDDDLLAQTMSTSLRNTRAAPVDIVDFVVAALEHRLLDRVSITTPIESLDLGGLEEQARTALVQIVTQTLEHKPAEHTIESWGWVNDAIAILLASYPNPLASQATSALISCMEAALIPVCKVITDRRLVITPTFHPPLYDAKFVGSSMPIYEASDIRPHLAHIFRELRNKFKELNVEDTLYALYSIIMATKDICDGQCGSSPHDSKELGALLRAHYACIPSTEVRDILEDIGRRLRLILVSFAAHIVRRPKGQDDCPKLLGGFVENIVLLQGQEGTSPADLSLRALRGVFPKGIPSARLSEHCDISPAARDTVIENIAKSLIQRLQDVNNQWDDTTGDTLAIIVGLCDTPPDASSSAAQALAYCVESSLKATFETLGSHILAYCVESSLKATFETLGSHITSLKVSAGLSYIFQICRNAFKVLNVGDTLFALYTITKIICNGQHGSSPHTCTKLEDILRKHSEYIPSTELWDILQDCADRRHSEVVQQDRWTPSDSDFDLLIAAHTATVGLDGCSKLFGVFIEDMISLQDGTDLPLVPDLSVRALRNVFPKGIPSACLDTYCDISPATQNIIIESTARRLIQRLPDDNTQWNVDDDDLGDALAVIVGLCSIPPDPNSSAASAIKRCIQFWPEATSTILGFHDTLSSDISRGLSHIFGRLRVELDLLDLKSLLGFILTTIRNNPILCDETCYHQSDDLGSLMLEHPELSQSDVLADIIAERRLLRHPVDEPALFPLYLDLVVAADISQKDDAFLVEFILPVVLEKHQHTPSDSMQFMLSLIRNRRKQNVPVGDMSEVFDVAASPGVWKAIIDSIAAILEYAIPADLDAVWEEWMKDAFIILLSLPGDGLTAKANVVIERCAGAFNNWDSTMNKLVSESLSSIPVFTAYRIYFSIFKRLRRTPSIHLSSQSLVQASTRFIRGMICDETCGHGAQLGDIFSAHRHRFQLFSLLVDFLMASGPATHELDDILFSIFSSNRYTMGGTLREIDPPGILEEFYANLIISASEVAIEDIFVLDYTYGRLGIDDRIWILDSFKQALVARGTHSKILPELTPLKVAFLYLHLMCLRVHDRRIQTLDDLRAWSKVLHCLVSELRKLGRDEYSHARQHNLCARVARKCLSLLLPEGHRDAIQKFINSVPVLRPPVFNDLTNALKVFIPQDELSQYGVLFPPSLEH